MSRVFAFRLDDAIPDEARAMELLDQAVANGATIRQAIVYAVLQANGYTPAPPPNAAADLIAALQETLTQAKALTATLQQQPAAPPPPHPIDSGLKPEFREAVKKAARKGFKLES